ncbi:hypothetical protein SADUNF_Sadunf04G0082100 [Salix dunnii]|uniref:Uncharacterized protein n=1 Tax=Salix dunnii TaxID=1413687 RepID=A0A835N0P1_9ROSI|nr:hypothetical protein SADUNF_Sadunf04G0082100 [Salix dunnii]
MEMVVLLLLLEKVLTSKYESEEDRQRTRIFHYTCTVKDKVVKKLQLIMKNHLKHYKMTWLNKDNKASIVLCPFPLGKNILMVLSVIKCLWMCEIQSKQVVYALVHSSETVMEEDSSKKV